MSETLVEFPPTEHRIAQVLLDSALPQLDHLFDYEVPPELSELIRVGQRVRVPFRSQNRKSFGYVVALQEHSTFTGTLQAITEIVGTVPVLTPEVYTLARAVADRAGGSAGDVLRLAIPPRMVRAEKQHLASVQHTAPHTDASAEAIHSDPKTPAENVLGTHTETTSETNAPDDPTVPELLISGARLAQTPSHGPVRLETGEWIGGWAKQLAETAAQIFALHRSVIIVTPDYRDTDQVADALDSLGHTDTVRVDSRQSGSERYAHFLRALDATPRIILGNRSAVYAPAHQLGAILLWDDGDPVLAEPLTPYVHARDAALIRAEQSGAGLLFAAHSRSAEVQRLIELGYVQSEHLPPKRTRVVAADAITHQREPFPNRIPEFAARQIREALEVGPVLVQVATPGYAPITVCAACSDIARCLHCGGPLALHPRDTHASCRWCAWRAVGWQCGSCRGTQLQVRGFGSERTAEQFSRQFPHARVILSDGSHQVERIDSRPALVVATRGAEPIAAGGYRCVVLLDVERLLSRETLRASEDCLRWWLNAAALAAPDATCIVASGGGPVVRALVTGRAETWVQRELTDRRELRYPPMVRVASVTGGSAQVQRAIDTLTGVPHVEILGPAPYEPRFSPPATPETGGAGATLPIRSEVSLMRAIVRFEYAQGAEVARRLRGALVADAAGASSRVTGRATRRARPDALKLRFDDRGVFDS